ncbi:MAG: CHRD domain-containing protein [Nitrososphaeraceae archaeon]
MPVKTQIIHDSLLGLAAAIIFISLSDSSSVFAQLNQQTFTTQMSGGEEVPSVSTTSTGTAEFNLGSGGGIDYQVSVTGVSNVTSVSINSGNVGENGPVIVTLFRPNASADLANDVQAGGTITSSDLEGPMQGKAISDLVSAMSSGVTYVNVNTQANPDGEIRGQI